MIQPNENTYSQTLLESWPQHDENTFYQDSETATQAAQEHHQAAQDIINAKTELTEAMKGGISQQVHDELDAAQREYENIATQYEVISEHMNVTGDNIVQVKENLNTIDTALHEAIDELHEYAKENGVEDETLLSQAVEDMVNEAKEEVAKQLQNLDEVMDFSADQMSQGNNTENVDRVSAVDTEHFFKGAGEDIDTPSQETGGVEQQAQVAGSTHTSSATPTLPTEIQGSTRLASATPTVTPVASGGAPMMMAGVPAPGVLSSSTPIPVGSVGNAVINTRPMKQVTQRPANVENNISDATTKYSQKQGVETHTAQLDVIAASLFKVIRMSGWPGSVAVAQVVKNDEVTFFYATEYGYAYLPPRLDVDPAVIPCDLVAYDPSIMNHIGDMADEKLMRVLSDTYVQEEFGVMVDGVVVCREDVEVIDEFRVMSEAKALRVAEESFVYDKGLSRTRDFFVPVPDGVSVPVLFDEALKLVPDNADEVGVAVSGLVGAKDPESALINAYGSMLRELIRREDSGGVAWLASQLSLLV